ncbi:MAG: hypothetical protein LBQ40_02720 [Clostridiales bacterium]|jgi:hypothetical protein|nr:hypothetical protein [Clostridiales bacterium]
MSGANNENIINALPQEAAYNLSDVFKTPPQFEAITPRLLTKTLEFKALEAGVYRVNKTAKTAAALDIFEERRGKSTAVPSGYIDYERNPREYRLECVSTIVNVDTRVGDIYGSPYNQAGEQLNLAMEILRERQEYKLINDDGYGLLKNAAPSMRISPIKNAPAPDDLDELLSMVWKSPSFFAAHPRAISAFLRECTRRGVPPVTADIDGAALVLWRGIPIIPCDKLLVDGRRIPDKKGGKTNILLIRSGEERRGAIGLYQAGLHAEESRGLSVRYRGVDDDGVASYLLSLYCSAAILADDAVAVLENAEVGEYYDYK